MSFADQEEALALIGFFPRHVQGLYSFIHFQHIDGKAFVQIPVSASQTFIFCRGDGTRPQRFATFAAVYHDAATKYAQEF